MGFVARFWKESVEVFKDPMVLGGVLFAILALGAVGSIIPDDREMAAIVGTELHFPGGIEGRVIAYEGRYFHVVFKGDNGSLSLKEMSEESVRRQLASQGASQR